jgi:hypothetical protein
VCSIRSISYKHWDCTSLKWNNCVNYLIKEIKKQTKISYKNQGYGELDFPLKFIDKKVFTEYRKNMKGWGLEMEDIED